MLRRLHQVDVRLGDDTSGLAELALTVADPDGRPVEAAEIRVDDVMMGRTTNSGALEVRGLSVGERQLEVWAPLLQPVTQDIRLMEDREEIDLDLQWAPGAVRFRVDGPEGPVTDALLRILGPSRVPPTHVDIFGERILVLGAGRWQVFASSSSLGLAQHSFDVIPQEAVIQEITVDIAPAEPGLASLWLRVESDSGTPVPDAVVLLDGVRVGQTGEGGALLITALPAGTAEITVSADGHVGEVTREIVLDGGIHERILRLVARTGTVSVTVTAPDGSPAAADLILSGSMDHPGTLIDTGEQAVIDLPPGEWALVAASSVHGPGRASILIEPGGDHSLKLQLTPRLAAMESQAVVLEDPIRFDFDRATLTDAAGPILDAVAALLLARPSIIRLEIEGHTDNVGDLAYNRSLSQRRAEVVLEALVTRGVAREVLTAAGYGAQKPIQRNDDDDGRAENRRVEFRIAEVAE
jgi:outer membrane protein OmpA-like peptidoglycan-associated protein